MRKLVLKMAMSLDAFVGGPNGELDWMFSRRTPEGAAWTVAAISDASLHIMGSRTYQDMIAWWPQSNEPFAAPMNDIPKAVFSRTGNLGATTQAIVDATNINQAAPLAESAEVSAKRKEWASASILRGDMSDEIQRLKKTDGKPIVAHGGARFARSLIATGLVDEFKLLVFPIALGRGLPIFSDLPRPLSLTLMRETELPGGCVAREFRPA